MTRAGTLASKLLDSLVFLAHVGLAVALLSSTDDADAVLPIRIGALGSLWYAWLVRTGDVAARIALAAYALPLWMILPLAFPWPESYRWGLIAALLFLQLMAWGAARRKQTSWERVF